VHTTFIDRDWNLELSKRVRNERAHVRSFHFVLCRSRMVVVGAGRRDMNFYSDDRSVCSLRLRINLLSLLI
jgi:hypothetical protein